MPIQDDHPLARLCQKAGSTLDEVLALDESELEELSKEIVGNGVLDHARVIRQWRRCRLEEDLRKEIEVELANEGQEEEVQVIEEVQEEVLDAVDIREKQNSVIGESWQEYLRKQIRVEIDERKPPPVKNVVTPSRTTTSCLTEDCASEGDYETFMESITLDPSLLGESSEEEDDDDSDDGYDEKTSYNPVMAVGCAASDIMGALEDEISKFFEPRFPKKKPEKKKPSKSFFEAGMDYIYAEEPKKSSRNKKKKNSSGDGMGYFYDVYSGANKENNKKKKPMTKTRNKKKSRRRKQKTQSQQPQEQAYKLVPTRSLPLSRFRC